MAIGYSVFLIRICWDCGHLRFGKLPCPHIRKNAICNPSSRFGGSVLSAKPTTKGARAALFLYQGGCRYHSQYRSLRPAMVRLLLDTRKRCTRFLHKIDGLCRLFYFLQILPFRGSHRSTDFAEVNAKKYRLKIKYF